MVVERPGMTLDSQDSSGILVSNTWALASLVWHVRHLTGPGVSFSAKERAREYPKDLQPFLHINKQGCVQVASMAYSLRSLACMLDTRWLHVVDRTFLSDVLRNTSNPSSGKHLSWVYHELYTPPPNWVVKGSQGTVAAALGPRYCSDSTHATPNYLAVLFLGAGGLQEAKNTARPQHEALYDS